MPERAEKLSVLNRDFDQLLIAMLSQKDENRRTCARRYVLLQAVLFATFALRAIVSIMCVTSSMIMVRAPSASDLLVIQTHFHAVADKW